MTIKSYWSRSRNVREHLNSDTQKGKVLRKQFRRVTKKKRYSESSFKRMDKQNKKYGVREVASVVSKVEHIKELKLKRRWVKLGKPTTWKKFKKANMHVIDYDIEDMEIYYDSP